MITLSELIGQTLVDATEPWDDDLEQDQIRLTFESATIIISAIDSSGMGAGSIACDQEAAEAAEGNGG